MNTCTWSLMNLRYSLSSIGRTLLAGARPSSKTIIFNCPLPHFSFIFRYYLGTPEHAPGQQHLYRVSAVPPSIGVSLNRPQCMTCSKNDFDKMTTTTNAPPRLVTLWDDEWEAEPTLPPATTQSPKRRRGRKESSPGIIGPTACQYHRVEFAPGPLALALIECLGPDVPSSAIYRMPVEYTQRPMKPIFYVQNNTKLRERVATVALPQVKSFPVMISGGYRAQVRLFLPPGLREDEITRYPMILHV